MNTPTPESVAAALTLADASHPYDPEKMSPACDAIKSLRLDGESYYEATSRILAAEARRLREENTSLRAIFPQIHSEIGGACSPECSVEFFQDLPREARFAVALRNAEVRRLRDDRDCEKRLRKDAEEKLCAAAELLEAIMRGKVNPEVDAEKWLRAHDPIRLREAGAGDAQRLRTTLETVADILRNGSPAITDTIWIGPGETLLDRIESVLAEKNTCAESGNTLL